MEYEILGVDEKCDLKTAKKALNEIRKKYHPDRHINAHAEIIEQFERI